MQEAGNVYQSGKDYGPIVVVVQFPRKLYDTRIRGKNLLSRKLAYFHPVRKAFTAKPEFVTHPNPYPDRQPVSGHEKFDVLFD